MEFYASPSCKKQKVEKLVIHRWRSLHFPTFSIALDLQPLFVLCFLVLISSNSILLPQPYQQLQSYQTLSFSQITYLSGNFEKLSCHYRCTFLLTLKLHLPVTKNAFFERKGDVIGQSWQKPIDLVTYFKLFYRYLRGGQGHDQL